MKPRAGNPLPPVEESVADHGSETLSTSIPDPSETGPAPEKVPEVDAQDVDANDEAGAVVSLPLPVDPSPEVPITPKQKKIFNLSSLTKKDPNAVHLQDSRGCLRSGFVEYCCLLFRCPDHLFLVHRLINARSRILPSRVRS